MTEVLKKKTSKSFLKVFENALYEKLKVWKESGNIYATDDVLPIIPNKLFAAQDIVVLPTALCSAERRIVHKVALKLQLYHASFGQGIERYACVSKISNFNGMLATATSTKQFWCNPTVPKVKRTPKALAISETDFKAKESFLNDLDPSMLSYTIVLDGYMNLEAFTNEPSIDDSSIVVDTVDALKHATKVLSQASIIGFDCEMHNYQSYFGITCCIQLSDGTTDFIVDCLSLWDDIPDLLGPLFASPGIVKVGHSVMGGDVPALYRDFGIIVVNAFDTQIAALALGLSGTGKSWDETDNKVKSVSDQETPISDPTDTYEYEGVDADEEGPETGPESYRTQAHAALQTVAVQGELEDGAVEEDRVHTNGGSGKSDPHCAIGFGALLTHFRCPLAAEVSESKPTMRMCDWRVRPLSPSMRRYALLDVHFLPALFHVLTRHLLRAGGVPLRGLRCSSLGAAAEEEEGSMSSLLQMLHRGVVVGPGVDVGTANGDGSYDAFDTTATGNGEASGQAGTGAAVDGDVEKGGDVDDEGGRVEEGEDGDDNEDEDEDEDEDLWEGWGQAGGARGAEGAAVDDVLVGVGVAALGGKAAVGLESSPTHCSGQSSLCVDQELPATTPCVTAAAAAAVDHNATTATTAAAAADDDDASGSGSSRIPVPSGRWRERLVWAGPHSPPYERGTAGDDHDKDDSVYECPTYEALQSAGYSSLARVLQRSLMACSRLWTPPHPCDESPEGSRVVSRVMKTVRRRGLLRGIDRWGEKNNIALRGLLVLRDREARVEDESPSCLCALDVLVDYARELPTTTEELMRVRLPLPEFLACAERGEVRLQELLEVMRLARDSWLEQRGKTEVIATPVPVGDAAPGTTVGGASESVTREAASTSRQEYTDT